MAKQTKRYVITSTNSRTGRCRSSRPMTVEEAVDYYSYTLECGASWSHEKGNHVINCCPTTIKSLITNLNNASSNSARNGYGDYYEAKEFVGEVDSITV